MIRVCAFCKKKSSNKNYKYCPYCGKYLSKNKTNKHKEKKEVLKSTGKKEWSYLDEMTEEELWENRTHGVHGFH